MLLKVFMGVLCVSLLVLMVLWICFSMAFYVSQKQRLENERQKIPKGKAYKPYGEKIQSWIRELYEMPCEHVYITSRDGLKLHGRYFERFPGAPMELMFHGYRGTADRDLCGGVQRCFALGRNALLVDQRCSGKSQGRVITFGVKESGDCLEWIDFVIRHYGEDTKIILTGISMGAATVMMAAGKELPKNVIGVLADCGYTSAKDIIKLVIKQMKLPANLMYPFVKLSARLFGGFSLEEFPPVEAMKRCKLPVIFFHGEEDGFVPCWMSERNYEACSGPKRLYIIPKADHGLSYLLEPEHYIQEFDEFSGLTMGISNDRIN